MAATRDRIIEATASLLQRRGYNASGLKQISSDSGAPFGSLYHFFPDGKAQLGREVILRSGQMYQELVEAVLDSAPDIVTAMRHGFLGAAETLRQTDYADACPIETVALEVASINEPLRQATAEVFEGWIAALTERFAAAGIAPQPSRELAIAFICALEGAFVLCRAMRTTEPLEIAGEQMATAVEQALPEEARRSS